MITLLFFSSIKQYCIASQQESCPKSYTFVSSTISEAISTINSEAQTRIQLALLDISENLDLAELTDAKTIYISGQGQTNVISLSISIPTSQTILISNCVIKLPDANQAISVKSLSLSGTTFDSNPPSSIVCQSTFSFDSSVSNQIPSSVQSDKIIITGKPAKSLSIQSLSKFIIESPQSDIIVKPTSVSYSDDITITYDSVPQVFEVTTSNNFAISDKTAIPVIKSLTINANDEGNQPIIDVSSVHSLYINTNCTLTIDSFNNSRIINSILTLTKDVTCNLGVVGLVLKNSKLIAPTESPVSLTLIDGRFEIRNIHGAIAENVNIIGTDIGLFVHESVATAETTTLTIKYYHISFDLFEEDAPSLTIKSLKLGNREFNTQKDMQFEFRPAEWRSDDYYNFSRLYPIIVATNDDFCPANVLNDFLAGIYETKCDKGTVYVKLVKSPKSTDQDFNYLATNEKDPEFHPISSLSHIADFVTSNPYGAIDIIMNATTITPHIDFQDIQRQVTVKGGILNLEASKNNNIPLLILQDTMIFVNFKDDDKFIDANLLVYGDDVLFDEGAKSAVFREGTIPYNVFVKNGLSINNFQKLTIQLNGNDKLEFNENGWVLNDIVMNGENKTLVIDYLDCLNQDANLTVTTKLSAKQEVKYPVYFNKIVHAKNININLDGDFGNQVYFYIENTAITFKGKSTVIPIHYIKGNVKYEPEIKSLTADMDNDATVLFLNGAGIKSLNKKVIINDFEIPETSEETHMVFSNTEVSKLSFENSNNVTINGLTVAGASNLKNSKGITFDNVNFKEVINTYTTSTVVFHSSTISSIKMNDAKIEPSSVPAIIFMGNTMEEVRAINITADETLELECNVISYLDPFVSPQAMDSVAISFRIVQPVPSSSSTETTSTETTPTETSTETATSSTDGSNSNLSS